MEFDTNLKGTMFCKPLRIGAFIGVPIFNKYFVNVILFALKPNVAFICQSNYTLIYGTQQIISESHR